MTLFLRKTLLCLGLLTGLVLLVYSCKKKEDKKVVDASCDSSVCMNGTKCYDGSCRCPLGLEDATCGTFAADRYRGVWKMKDSIMHSSKATNEHRVNWYEVTISIDSQNYQQFIMDGLGGNANDKGLMVNMQNPIDRTYNPLRFRLNGKPFDDCLIISGSGTMTSSSSFYGTYVKLSTDSLSNDVYDTALIITQKLH